MRPFALALGIALGLGQVQAADPIPVFVVSMPPLTPTQAVVPVTPQTPLAPGRPSPDLSEVTQAPTTDFSESSPGGTEQAASAAPNMMGDSNGGACGSAMFQGVLTATLDHPAFFCSQTKIAEDNSPIPQDRVYFNYQHFASASGLSLTAADTGFTVARSLDIDRYTMGVEKTFFDGNASVEVRIPINNQLTNALYFNSDENTINSDTTIGLGNIAIALKGIVADWETLRVSAGLLVQLPTIAPVNIHDFETGFVNPPTITGDGVDINNTYRFRFTSVITSPFIGYLYQPDDRFFVQGFEQVDIDPNGSYLDIMRNIDGVALPTTHIRLHEQTLLRTDIGTGYWVYRDPEAMFLTGVAPILELHYTTTLDNAQIGAFQRAPGGNTVMVGNLGNRLDIIDLLGGVTLKMGESATLAAGYVVPLSTGMNRPFDYEVNVQLNWKF
jgi:hypothetical protein